MWVSYVSSFSQSNSIQKHVHKTLYENHYRSRSPIFSVYVQPASRWVRVVWKCVVAIATTHRSCSLFSEKKHRGNSAFSPSICLASCLHAWCATISEANSLRRREARWLTEYLTKQSTICWPLPGWQLKGRGSLAGLTSRPKQDV